MRAARLKRREEMKKLMGLLAVGAILAVPATPSAGHGVAYGRAVQECYSFRTFDARDSRPCDGYSPSQ